MTVDERLQLEPGTLVLLLSVPGFEADREHIVLTKKVVEGLTKYQELWRGPVHAIFPPGRGRTDNLDDARFRRSDLPFTVEVLPFTSEVLKIRAKQAALVMGVPHHELHGFAAYCRSIGVPYVLTTEYSLRTRLQIIRAEQPSPLRRVRQYVWELGQEHATRREVRLSAGVQCNGVPTYRAYRSLSSAPLLYFDSRIDEAMLSSPERVRAKAERMRARGSLNLAFSGRLNAMKGADHLVRVAAALRARAVPFVLHVCGGGPLEGEMRDEVQRRKLEQHVKFHRVLDFERELIPFIRDEIDLFVCCHRQGDPSCTYVETFACGVPIIGYDNEAFAGLLEFVDAGWATPMDDPKALARRIETLYQHPTRLEEAALRALEFATQNRFERTFAERIAHMKRLARSAGESSAAPVPQHASGLGA
jgi:colanic acid/amylovoran biosynthesis glycosyltransferase